MIPKTEKEYQQLIKDQKHLVGKLLAEYNTIFDEDETVEILPEYDETGEQTGFVAAQTWGTWNPQEIDNICVDNIGDIQVVKTWKNV